MLGGYAVRRIVGNAIVQNGNAIVQNGNVQNRMEVAEIVNCNG